MKKSLVILGLMMFCVSGVLALDTYVGNDASYFNGSVGIGTSTPGVNTSVDIYGVNPILRITDPTDDNVDFGDNFGEIQFWATESDNDFPGVRAGIRAMHTRTGTGHDATDAGLVFSVSRYNNNPTTFDAMIIDSLGNVGIGTNEPSSELHVEGDVNVTGSIYASDNSLYLGEGKISFNETSNKFVYYNDSGANEIVASEGAWSTSGNAVYYDAGRVGIRTSDPQADLHIKREKNSSDQATIILEGARYASGRTFADIKFQNYDQDNDVLYNGSVIRSFNDGGNMSGALQFDVSDEGSSVTAMTISKDGNVGIGDSTPDARVEINDYTGTRDALYIVDDNGGNAIQVDHDNSTNAAIYINDNSNNSAIKINVQGSGYGLWQAGNNSAKNYFEGRVSIGTTDSPAFLTLDTDTTTIPLLFFSDSKRDITYKAGDKLQIGEYNTTDGTFDNRFHIDDTGRIGVDTINPKGKFHIQSYGLDAQDSASSTNYTLNLHDFDGANGKEIGISFSLYGNDVIEADETPGAAITHERTGGYSQGKLHFKTKNGTAGSDPVVTRMTIDEDGYVGIGVTNPSENLEIGESFNTDYTGNRVTIGNSAGPSALMVGEGDKNRGWFYWSDSSDHLRIGVETNDVIYDTMYVVNDTVSINEDDPNDVGLHIFSNTRAALFVDGGFTDISWPADEVLQIEPYNETSGTYGDGLTISSNGNVGIRRVSASNELEVNGTASKDSAGNWLANSDRRIKTDIQEIENALDTIEQLRPVKFKYEDWYKANHSSLEDKYYYNFIAQEYQEVFPESVGGSGEFLENGSEILQMDSYNAQVVAIKAIQELNEKVEEKDAEIEMLKSEFCANNGSYSWC